MTERRHPSFWQLALLHGTGWIPLPPERQWVRTMRAGEDGENECAVWSEWTDRDGRTTVTHHSFAAPTHWKPK